jgi:hypothetical protein
MSHPWSSAHSLRARVGAQRWISCPGFRSLDALWFHAFDVFCDCSALCGFGQRVLKVSLSLPLYLLRVFVLDVYRALSVTAFCACMSFLGLVICVLG